MFVPENAILSNKFQFTSAKISFCVCGTCAGAHACVCKPGVDTRCLRHLPSTVLIFCSTQLHLAFQGPALTSSYGCCRVYLLAICPVPTFAWSSILKASSFRTERKQENPCINHLASKTCYFVHGSKTLLM